MHSVNCLCSTLRVDTWYNDFEGTTSTKFGQENEGCAVAAFERLTQLKTKECGILIDCDFSYLAASPDRLVIDEDAILEVKCPYNARDLTTFEATEKKIMKFLEISDSKLKLKINDNYMYQIQGQLHITKKEKCYFVV
jgi:predicted phage-related endonuclease